MSDVQAGHCLPKPGLFRRLGLAVLTWLLVSVGAVRAQENPQELALEVVAMNRLDTIPTQKLNQGFFRNRPLLVTALHSGVYSGILYSFYKAWYENYPRTSFKVLNDWGEWNQMDKVGHVWSTYQNSRASMMVWKWAGVKPSRRHWYGALVGTAFSTGVEWFDGHSEGWGWSWWDMAANLAGSGLLVGQELAWKEQRISVKFSFHRMNYKNPVQNQRSDFLFGSKWYERMLKDYNGQTYWLSANLKSFFPKSKLPAWLNVAVGYGATNMMNGWDYTWLHVPTNQFFNGRDFPRKREWYLSPDVDFTRIKTNSKLLRSVLFFANMFKLPAPTLVLSNGRFVVQGFYF